MMRKSGKLAQHKFRAGRGIDDEQLHRARAGVQRRMEAAFGHEDRAAGADLLGDRVAVRVLDHLLAMAGDDEDDLFRAGMVVAAVPLPRRQIDHAAREPLGAIGFGRHGQGQLAPVKAEGIHILGIDEVVFRFRGHDVLIFPVVSDLKACTCALIASSTGSRSIELAP